jgi:hypothetical protein
MHSDRMQSDGRQMIWDCVQERRNYMHHIFFVTKLKANVGASKYSSIKNMDKHQSLTAVWVIARTVW